MVTNERSRQICDRLNEISAELREIALEIGSNIHILTSVNREGKTATTTYAAKYRMDHFFEGYERLSYAEYSLTPEQVVFGAIPKGLETTILQKELKKRKREMKR